MLDAFRNSSILNPAQLFFLSFARLAGKLRCLLASECTAAAAVLFHSGRKPVQSCPLWFLLTSASCTMDRIEFINSPEHRKDAALAAFFCDQSSQKQDLSVMRQACRQHVLTDVHIAGLEGGTWVARHDRRATVTAFGTTIVIAFRGANDDERLFNLCFLGKGKPIIKLKQQVAEIFIGRTELLGSSLQSKG